MHKKIKISRLLPDVSGVYIKAECENCKQEFTQYLPTIFGLGFCTLICPGCPETFDLEPMHLIEAAENCFSATVDHDAINRAASRVAEKWYRFDEIAEAFDYDGINLGEPAERFLVSAITNGILLSQLREGGE